MNQERRRLDEPINASLSVPVCDSAPFGTPPHRLGLNLSASALKVPGSGTVLSNRPAHRTDWPPFMEHRPTRKLRAHCCSTQPARVTRGTFRLCEQGRRGRENQTCCPTCPCRTGCPLTQARLAENGCSVEARNFVLSEVWGLRDKPAPISAEALSSGPAGAASGCPAPSSTASKTGRA